MNFSGGFNSSAAAGGFHNSTGFSNTGGSYRGGSNRRGQRNRGGNRGGGQTGGFNQSNYQAQLGGGANFQRSGANYNQSGRGGASNGYTGRGQSRGGKRSGGLIFSDKLVSFNMAVDAHVSTGHRGTIAVTSWDENSTVFTGGADGVVKMYNVNDGSCTEQLEGKEVSALCQFSGWLFVGIVNPGGVTDVGFVKAYNFTTLPPQSFNLEIDSNFPAAHHSHVNSICVGNGMVFTGGDDFAVRGWSLDKATNSWKLAGSLGGVQAHNCSVRKIAFVGEHLFTGGEDGTINVWSAQGVLVSEFQAHSARVTGICGWSGASQNVLLTCSHDSTIKVWELAAGIVPSGANPVFSYPPDGLGAKPKAVNCMITHHLQDGTQILVVGTMDGSIRILDLPDFRDLGYTRGHQRNHAITSMTIVQPNNLLFAGSMNGQLNCYKFIA